MSLIALASVSCVQTEDMPSQFKGTVVLESSYTISASNIFREIARDSGTIYTVESDEGKYCIFMVPHIDPLDSGFVGTFVPDQKLNLAGKYSGQSENSFVVHDNLPVYTLTKFEKKKD
ncbi:MAG: hypothetical protein ACP5N1_00175 [Candidatus Woesearchaeota archaeon]